MYEIIVPKQYNLYLRKRASENTFAFCLQVCHYYYYLNWRYIYIHAHIYQEREMGPIMINESDCLLIKINYLQEKVNLKTKYIPICMSRSLLQSKEEEKEIRSKER